MIDLRLFIDAVESIVARHALDGPGRYGRFTMAGADEHGAPRDLGLNAYGCADAANLLHTIGRLPELSAVRAAWVDTLQGLQDEATGFFREHTHHEIHTTAHCLGALELFDARPRHRLSGLAGFLDPTTLVAFLEGLDWRGAPWTEAHRGAGLYAALEIVGDANSTFANAYFDWLSGEVDSETGLLRRGCVDPSPSGGAFPHLAGSFHYLFNFEHAKRPWPHAAALVDTCLAIRTDGSFPLGKLVWFADIDWVYCLSRAVKQSGHRAEEAQRALTTFAEEYAGFLLGLDPQHDSDLDDLHRLFGAVCALAELQQAVPGLLETRHPLRLVLDRRPFI